MQLEQCLGMEESSFSEGDARSRRAWEHEIELRIDRLRQEEAIEPSDAMEWKQMLEQVEEEKLMLCRNTEV